MINLSTKRSQGLFLPSIGTVGSIANEHSTNGLKYEIITIKYNRLSDDQVVVMLVASENLKYWIKARMSIAESVADSLLVFV